MSRGNALTSAYRYGKLTYVKRDKKKKNPFAVALGRRGGKARAARLTPEEQSAIARKASLARWARAKRRDEQKT